MTTVCVTGASGYIASWLVKLLLQRGYTVKACVRDVDDPKRTQHLLGFDGANVRLQLFKANLLEEGSFDAAIDGCEGVFHTASPVLVEVTDPQAELIDPALKGTLNVLGSCARTPSVNRVVLTSSTAAVNVNGKRQMHDAVIDETWWSDPDFCKETKQWYSLSKTLAEDAAWNFVKERGIDMITINPALVVGPLLQPKLNVGAATILDLLNGTETYPNGIVAWVDIIDVANAHILAFEKPSASGRYCLAGAVQHFSKIVKILHELYPTMKLPQKAMDDNPFQFMLPYEFSKEKAKTLGVEFTPLEQSIKGTVESLKEMNLFIPSTKH